MRFKNNGISIIVPTCNRPKLLIKTIKNILKQTKKNDEILIINNGYKKINFNNKHIKTINFYKPIGVANARNIGAKYSTKSYVAFIDDDDYWSKNYLKENKIIIKNRSPNIIINKIKIKQNNKLIKSKLLNNKTTLNDLFTQNPGITGSNVIFKKKVFIKLGGYRQHFSPSEDKEILIRYILKFKNLNEAYINRKNYCILNEYDGVRLSRNVLLLIRAKFILLLFYLKFFNRMDVLAVLKQILFLLIKSIIK